MVITDLLERNAKLYPDEVALVELNPQNQPDPNLTWREFSLIEANPGERYRREMTWKEFDVKANRFANLLLTRGVKKGDKVAILLMNCLEWLPVYFGVLKTGALAVPMNYRYSADEIKYCAELADASVLIFGPEFTERVQRIRQGKRPGRLAVAVANYVQQHLSEPVNTEDIAASLYMSRSHLSRSFSKETGSTPTDFILNEKTEEAKRLLRYSDRNISAIASYLGFSSQGHFIRVFKKYAGTTPGEYREKHR